MSGESSNLFITHLRMCGITMKNSAAEEKLMWGSGGGRDGDVRARNRGKNTKLYTNDSWILGGIDGFQKWMQKK